MIMTWRVDSRICGDKALRSVRMSRVADRAGPYRLLEEIGVDGMGEVHLALDPGGRTVAVKMLHPAVARDAGARRRLEREAETARLVRGPHVAEVLDADFHAPRPYIVTRYVQGRSLDAIVREQGPLTGAALVRLARGLARALHAIHSAGIVHRDLKPANVILADGSPVVIDFGLAQFLDATRLTLTGTAVGMPGYLAPEILDGDRAGPAADMFAWAAMAIRLLTLLVVVAAGFGGLAAVTVSLVPGPRGWALPAGLLAVSAGLVRAWFQHGRAPVQRVGVPILMAVGLAVAAVFVPAPLWWPLAR
jgi:serine/threonine protein kinase